MSLLIQDPESSRRRLLRSQTRHSLVPSSQVFFTPSHHTQLPRGSLQQPSSGPLVSGSVPLIVVPSQILPTAPPLRHQLTVTVTSISILVTLDLIHMSSTDLTVKVPLADTPPVSRANDPGLSSLLCRSNRLPAALHQTNS